MDSNINSKDIIFALDIGTRSVIGTVGIVKDKKFNVIAESYMEHQERAMIDGQIHDITLVAEAVRQVKNELEKQCGFAMGNVSIAAAGRFLRTTGVKVEMDLEKDVDIDKELIRALELNAVKKAEEEINKTSEGKLYCVGYSVKNYYLNGFVITNLLSHKGDKIEADVIATFLPRSVVDSLYSVMEKVKLQVISITLEPIAAIEAAIPKNLRLLNLALIDVGAGTSDIAISSKDTISAYGMVPLAGDEVTEVIAQNYLMDFNTAERVKRQCTEGNIVSYIDVMGLENQVSFEEISKVIFPVVDKVSDEIKNKILELNGGKAPNAVFMVGGGAHTPLLKEKLAEKLGIPPQRVGIKGREAVTDCVCTDNSMGSTGVTVLGIALISIKNLGHDFIDVNFNGSVISLFNSHRHTAMDVIIQGGMNPKLLMGRNGKNIKFRLNNSNRIAFGKMSTNSVIKVDGEVASLDTEVNDGSTVEVNFAVDGCDAKPKVLEYVNTAYCLSFYVSDKLYNLVPQAYINNSKVELDSSIHEGDEVEIILPKTLKDFKSIFKEFEVTSFIASNKTLSDEYVINEGDILYVPKKMEALDESKEGINVFVNEQKINMKYKESYIFVDIFDYIEFDRTRVKGKLVLKLNNKETGYNVPIKEGDNILAYWSNNC